MTTTKKTMTIAPNISLYLKKSLVKVSITNDVVLFVFQHVYSPFVPIFIVRYLPFSLQYQYTQALQMHYSIFKSNNNRPFAWSTSPMTPQRTMQPRWSCKWLPQISRSLVKAIFNMHEELLPIYSYTWMIVCSTIEDFDFMFGCINAGASEYLIKPLRADVIRTLPLVTILLNNNKDPQGWQLYSFSEITPTSANRIVTSSLDRYHYQRFHVSHHWSKSDRQCPKLIIQ